MWGDLPERERALGIRPGDPFMVDPCNKVDPRLTRYFSRSPFARLSDETKRSYTTDYRVFFQFLWLKGKDWADATSEDILDFEYWRRKDPSNRRPVGGSKWNRELAAIRGLYSWAVAVGYVTGNPVVTRSVRTRMGDVFEVAIAKAHDVRSSNVKWLTPAAFRLWRDVGLRGYNHEGRRDPSWRGRHDDRNAAYADFLYTTGLRRKEGAAVLATEILPLPPTGPRLIPTRLASATAKGGRARTYYPPRTVLQAIHTYVLTTRAEAVRRANKASRYEKVPDRVIVTFTSKKRRQMAHLEGAGGLVSERAVDSLTPRERERLFVRVGDLLEPAALWLGHDGMPMKPDSWNGVFDRASERAHDVLKETLATPPFCYPHMCRHSFALTMLVALHHVLDSRFGLTPEERRDYRLLYGDPFRIVKDLLGHASEDVTRNIYLAPVSDLQVRTLLLEESEPDIASLLSELARRSDQVIDIDGAIGQ